MSYKRTTKQIEHVIELYRGEVSRGELPEMEHFFKNWNFSQPILLNISVSADIEANHQHVQTPATTTATTITGCVQNRHTKCEKMFQFRKPVSLIGTRKFLIWNIETMMSLNGTY